ncbi:MAG: two-domain cob(I)yrinic acid a,c-diamide adenosyltransferase PduO [Scandinavium sp.]|uniref:two-domain cob(I)yrinic acid a,c-diamide adenosyltransferase PduO n=1 Tax=Scandinavium sp. TaxID=2830653 RepID=UPI003F3A4516
MAIYTRTGDSGTTTLFTGERVSKTHPRVETYGTLDELNSAVSLCICASTCAEHRELLESVQHHLFWLSAELASEGGAASAKRHDISIEDISALEAAIDTAMGRVTPLKQFILPGRCEAASRLHFARTLARRAERRLVELSATAIVRSELLRYLNRLSDCLYALARAEDHDAHQQALIQEVTRRYLSASPTATSRKSAMSLSFKDLHQLTQAAVRHAEALGVPVVVSIVDAYGTQTVTWRMPDALLVSSELAPKKAWTAVAMKTATHELSAAVQPGAELYGLESQMQGKVVTFGGGFPLWRESILIGGLGISGGSVEQDMDIARAAILALETRIPS